MTGPMIRQTKEGSATQPVIRMLLPVGGLLLTVATLLHPSQETAVAILETEARLVGSHAVYVASYLLILLGLPSLYEGATRPTGLLGPTGFFVTFAGTAFLAISSQFGFIAPVLAAGAPSTLDEISRYVPVVVFNSIAAAAFMAGYVTLGIAIARSRVFPGWTGILIAIGAPVHLVGFGVAQLSSPGLWFIAVLGSVALGLGLAGSGLAASPNRASRVRAAWLDASHREITER